MQNPSQSYRASPATRDHTVLPATRHRKTCPALTRTRQAGTQLNTYPKTFIPPTVWEYLHSFSHSCLWNRGRKM